MHSQTETAEWDKQQRDLGASFLQTALWSEFQESIGNRAHFIAGSGWSCLLIERRAAIGAYLLAPYGPTIGPEADSAKLFDEIKKLGREKKADWLRLEPVFDYQTSHIDQIKKIKKAGGKPAANEFNPPLTMMVDLTRPEDEILSSFSQTTRNIIRRNIRDRTISFRTSRLPEEITLFTNMIAEVGKRNNAVFYSPGYYRKEAETLMPAGMMVLELAYDGKIPLGTAVIHDFNGTTSYTAAASLPQARDKNVSALLLWQAMVNAKARGNKRMDLFGIAPQDAKPSHPWYGFSAFKRKFNGQIVEHAGTWDFPLTNKYKLYRAALTAKKIIRRR